MDKDNESFSPFQVCNYILFYENVRIMKDKVYLIAKIIWPKFKANSYIFHSCTNVQM